MTGEVNLPDEEEWNLIGRVCDKLDEVDSDLPIEWSQRIAREIIALVRRYTTAPHIDRASAIDELKKQASYWEQVAASQDYEPEYEVWLSVARRMRDRIAELEGD